MKTNAHNNPSQFKTLRFQLRPNSALTWPQRAVTKLFINAGSYHTQAVNDMSSSSPLDEWRFLIGTWKGTSKGQFGEKGVIEGVAVFSSEPSEAFIMEKGEGSSEGHFVNRSISLLFYDNVEQKFRRKTFFSYGFVNNELECSRDKNEIKFDIKMEPLPKNFEGTRWRSFIRKISDTKIAMGLEVAKEGEEFKKYGESTLTKIK